MVLGITPTKNFFAIDSAFVDRADIVQYVDLPPAEAIYEILRGCLIELVKKGIVCEVVSCSPTSIKYLPLIHGRVGCTSPRASADIRAHRGLR